MIAPDLLRELQDVLGGYSQLISSSSVLTLGFVALAILLLLVALAISGGRVRLRPHAAYEQLKAAVTDAAESGKPMHLSAGTGDVGGGNTAETLAGVTAVAAVAMRAANAHVPFVMTTPSPVVLPLLQAATEEAYRAAGVPDEYDPAQVRFAGEDRSAYAVHATDVVTHLPAGTSMITGALGEEILLIAEPSRLAGAQQIIGSASARALPYALMSAEHTIRGEEIFAAGAYLAGKRAHLASLLAQDWLRLSVVVAIIAGVVIKTMGG
jgi:hypothetical protein